MIDAKKEQLWNATLLTDAYRNLFVIIDNKHFNHSYFDYTKHDTPKNKNISVLKIVNISIINLFADDD